MQKRFCAFCSAERKVYLKKHAGLWDVVTAILMGTLVMWARWQEFQPKVVVIFIAILMAMEVVIQIRHRLSIVCQFCGFDPVLYKKNPPAAAQLVKSHMDTMTTDPDFLLSERAQSVLRRLKRARRSSKKLEIEM